MNPYSGWIATEECPIALWSYQIIQLVSWVGFCERIKTSFELNLKSWSFSMERIPSKTMFGKFWNGSSSKQVHKSYLTCISLNNAWLHLYTFSHLSVHLSQNYHMDEHRLKGLLLGLHLGHYQWGSCRKLSKSLLDKSRKVS